MQAFQTSAKPEPTLAPCVCLLRLQPRPFCKTEDALDLSHSCFCPPPPSTFRGRVFPYRMQGFASRIPCGARLVHTVSHRASTIFFKPSGQQPSCNLCPPIAFQSWRHQLLASAQAAAVRKRATTSLSALFRVARLRPRSAKPRLPYAQWLRAPDSRGRPTSLVAPTRAPLPTKPNWKNEQR
jgi:hypothetical protein